MLYKPERLGGEQEKRDGVCKSSCATSGLPQPGLADISAGDRPARFASPTAGPNAGEARRSRDQRHRGDGRITTVTFATAARAVLATAALGLVLVAQAAAAREGGNAIRTPDGDAVCQARGSNLVCTNRALQARAQPLLLVLGSNRMPHLAPGHLIWNGRMTVLRVGARERLDASSVDHSASAFSAHARMALASQ